MRSYCFAEEVTFKFIITLIFASHIVLQFYVIHCFIGIITHTQQSSVGRQFTGLFNAGGS